VLVKYYQWQIKNFTVQSAVVTIKCFRNYSVRIICEILREVIQEQKTNAKESATRVIMNYGNSEIAIHLE